jgi:hypothetical protein
MEQHTLWFLGGFPQLYIMSDAVEDGCGEGAIKDLELYTL